jgi:hypothetical protein
VHTLFEITPYLFPCDRCSRSVTWTANGWAATATDRGARRCADGALHTVDLHHAARHADDGEVFQPGAAGFSAARGESWVTLDGYGYFPAHLAADKWNGWAVPSFRRAVVDRIVRVLGRYGDARVGWSRADRDALVVHEMDANAPYQVDRDGSGRGPIGARAWAWWLVDVETIAVAASARVGEGRPGRERDGETVEGQQ